MKREYPSFDTEAALCQAFMRWAPKEWIAYPETAGWDILMVHREGGWQIGVEAKLSLNAKVLAQAISRRRQGIGPDFRAVLVGKIVAENALIANALGLTVIAPKALPRQHDWGGWTYAPKSPQGPKIPEFFPDLPEAERLVRIGEWWSDFDREVWFDCFPSHRHKLPDYVPEVAAGVPAPMVLSDWKIKAMRVCIWVQRHGVITRADFKKLGIDPSRWMNGVWLKAGDKRGDWVAGPHFPADQMRRQHPSVFAKIEADFETWAKKVAA